MSNEELNSWKEIPCLLEVDLEYPKDLHDLHNDYPLAPESLKVNKVEKLNDKPNMLSIMSHLNFMKSLD